ncbi:hypothetical protein [Lactobacillus helveticus]|uniref:hypothetical protein n=1 Tax=Lactobacillus helveticus TaxID=1587 RepID=UPI001561E994|nr:hypothetical protein [Lactobacillus helveticus]NRO87643.1 hypothetical protein [Lactobacillus helveticus]
MENRRKNAIDAMFSFHKAFKDNKDTDNTKVTEKIEALGVTDKNFLIVTRDIKDIKGVYPVSDVISDKLTLADLIMAYHLYLKELNGNNTDKRLISQINKFYKIK